MWKPSILVFNNVKGGKSVKGSFIYMGGKKIKVVTSGCGCTSVINDGDRIDVSMNTSFPTSVDADIYTQSKNITVTFTDNTKDILTISANLIK